MTEQPELIYRLPAGVKGIDHNLVGAGDCNRDL